MCHLHEYVPALEYSKLVLIPGLGETAQVPQAAFHKIMFDGDQLTSSRARGAQKARVNSLSPLTRLDGLIPCCEDWHTKVNLLGVSSVFKQLTSFFFI